MKITETKRELRKFVLEVDENELGFIWYWAADVADAAASATTGRLHKLIVDVFPEVEYKNLEECFIR